MHKPKHLNGLMAPGRHGYRPKHLMAPFPSTTSNEQLDEAGYQSWEEFQAEEWRRMGELTHTDILRICGLEKLLEGTS